MQKKNILFCYPLQWEKYEKITFAEIKEWEVIYIYTS